jgi:hypothetical protein
LRSGVSSLGDGGMVFPWDYEIYNSIIQ